MSDDKDAIERAKEALVYGPIGLAMYLRDTAPSFMKVFVARGRAELDQQRRTVGDQLGQARTVGETTTDSTAPQILRMVAEGLERVRETAEGAIGTLSGWAGESVSWSPGDAENADEPSPAGAAPAGYASAPVGDPSGPAPDPSPLDVASLAIPDYDELSASQVVDRLEGLAPEALTGIREYVRATRARATLLGKIEQLDRPV